MERDLAKINPKTAFSSWESCMSTISQKYDEETAKQICGALRQEGQAKIEAAATKDGFLVRAFLIDPSLNINKWAVTEESIPKNIGTFKGRPLVLTDNYDHPGEGIESLSHWLEYQKSFKVGEIIDIVPRKNPTTGSTAYHAVIEIENEDVKADIRNNKMPLYVSPAIAIPMDAHIAAEQGEFISRWEGVHLAIVDQPAFGIKKAVISDVCEGNRNGCLMQLRKAHIARFGLTGGCGFCVKGALQKYHQLVASRQLSTSHSANSSANSKKDSMSEIQPIDSVSPTHNEQKPIEKVEEPFTAPSQTNNKQAVNPPPSNTPTNIRDLLTENQRLLHELELRDLKDGEKDEALNTMKERLAALELRDRRKDIERIITPDIIKDDKQRLEKIKTFTSSSIPISEIEALYHDLRVTIKKANIQGRGARVPYGVTSNLSATGTNTSINMMSVDDETGFTPLQKQLAVWRGHL